MWLPSCHQDVTSDSLERTTIRSFYLCFSDTMKEYERMILQIRLFFSLYKLMGWPIMPFWSFCQKKTLVTLLHDVESTLTIHLAECHPWSPQLLCSATKRISYHLWSHPGQWWFPIDASKPNLLRKQHLLYPMLQSVPWLASITSLLRCWVPTAAHPWGAVSKKDSKEQGWARVKYSIPSHDFLP